MAAGYSYDGDEARVWCDISYHDRTVIRHISRAGGKWRSRFIGKMLIAVAGNA